MGTMRNAIALCLISIIIHGCGILDTEPSRGLLKIVLEKEESSGTLAKGGHLTSAQYILKKGYTVQSWEHIPRVNSYFNIEIGDLEPGDDYSVTLYGRTRDFFITASASQSGISVSQGKETCVRLVWSAFIPDMIMPPDGDTITGESITFRWSPIPGAELYHLMVDDDINFETPEISSFWASQSYECGQNFFESNVNYWRVRCRGHWKVTVTSSFSSERWGDWSEPHRFMSDGNP